MKAKILIVLMVFAVSTAMRADEKTYNEAMIAAFEQMKTAAGPSDFSAVANQFERIAKAEQNQWLPYYYSSYASIIQSFMSQDKTKMDLILDYAESMINEAIKLKPEESENFVIQGFLYCARITVDPNTRGAQYSQQAIGSFKKAQALNAENPRADYMLGMVMLNTPDFYGGGKAVAKPILEGAIQKYEKFVPLSPLHPTWGKEDCLKQLSACQQ